MRTRLFRLALVGAALATLAACQALPVSGASLTGARWIARTVDGAAVYGQRPITLAFGPDGRIGGHAGCNSYFGAYVSDGPRVDIRDIGATKMACEPALMRQESVYLNLLAAVDRHGLSSDGRLTLAAPNGRAIVFTRDANQRR